MFLEKSYVYIETINPVQYFLLFVMMFMLKMSSITKDNCLQFYYVIADPKVAE